MLKQPTPLADRCNDYLHYKVCKGPAKLEMKSCSNGYNEALQVQKGPQLTSSHGQHFNGINPAHI